ncbi:MAG: YdcH family protein [Deltaproteobacteria bacterium]
MDVLGQCVRQRPCKTAASDLCPESVHSFFSSNRIHGSKKNVPKPDHIANLERRQKALEEEIAKALLHCSPDDLVVADLKGRMLHLKEELERFRHATVRDRRLH